MRRRKSRHRALGRLASSAQLKMTSMMDILVTLLFFVLKSFVMDGEGAIVVPGIELPRSTSESLPAESIPVAILPQGILVGDEVVVSTEVVRSQPGMWVEPLGTKLRTAREKSESIARLKGEAPPQWSVTLQGDRDLEYHVLEKVMYTLDQAGYHEVALAVIQRPRDGA